MDQRLVHMSGARVLVVGDVILDRYWSGATRRISPEAPVPIVRVSAMEERVGGAANVAANVAALGGVATLVGVVGEDADGSALAALCEAQGIRQALQRLAGQRTVVKLRVVAQHQQMLRLDFEDAPDGAAAEAVARAVGQRLDDTDVVVLSDYAKGALGACAVIIDAARAAGRPLVVDPKGTDFARYRGATLLTPNLAEFEAVVGRCADGAQLVERARALARTHDFKAVLVTRGEHGMSLVPVDAEPMHLDAHAREVFDVTGAGDTVCAVVATALAAGVALPAAVALANTAAGLVVGKFGAATVTPAELDVAMARDSGVPRGVVSEAELLAERARAQRRGERVVMTNGCFDLLHEGHVRFLEQARALGSRLVVAVNDDASVRALKGPDRPLNPLASRMRVLAGLAAVDWVVAFTTPTPRELIARVLPDVLVKGGDYAVADIAGAAEVTAAGGAVLTLDYHAGHSTTALAERIGGARP